MRKKKISKAFLRISKAFLRISKAFLRIKKLPKLNFSISIKNYFNLFKMSLLSPNAYSKSIPEKKSPKSAWVFYLFNITISLVVYIFISKATSDNSSLFYDLSSLLLIIPVLILLFYFVCLVSNFLIKFFGGKGDYLDTLSALSFSSFPLIFLRVPILGFLSVFLFFFLSINNMKHTHKVSYLISGFSVLVPFFLIVFMASIALSLSNFSFFRV